MVELLGKPILEHVIDNLPPAIDELVIVVRYKAEAIKNYFGNSWKGRSIQYVYQEQANGTGHALFAARPLLEPKGKFVSLMGDNISGGKAIEEGLRYDFALLVKTHEHPEHFGVIELKKDGTVLNMHEHPKVPPSNLVSTGTMILSPGIFDTELIMNPDRKEYLLPDLLLQVARREPVHVVKQDFWVSVDKPEDIPDAEEQLRRAG
jgi:NDP-sugar pyrophosphorylase family protein